MAGNYASQQNSMFPYTGGDHSQQSNQHHGNYMNGNNDMTYLNYENSGDHPHQMFNNKNNYNQQNNFFASSNHQQQQSNDQFWNKRGQNRDHDQSINKLSSGVNQMSIDTNKNDKPKSELITQRSSLMTSKLQSQNAKQTTQQTATSTKTMSWASVASQPAKAQPKSYKSKLATVVLSTSTKHVPPPMPPVIAQISLDDIGPITNPWTKNPSSNKDDSNNEFEPNRNDNRNKLESNNHSRDYSAQQNHRQYRDNDPHQQKMYSGNNRFDDNNPPLSQQQSTQPPAPPAQQQHTPPQANINNNRSENRPFDNRPPYNDRFPNRNNGLNNSQNSHNSRSDNLRDQMRDNNNPRDSYQRDGYNQQSSNYQQFNNNYHNNNYNNRNLDYTPPQPNNRNYNSNYGGGDNNYNNYHNKYQNNQRSSYNQQNNQFRDQRTGGGGHHHMQNRSNHQMPPPQYPSKPIQLTEQQQIQQEKEAQALLEKLNTENNYNPERLDLIQKNAKYFIIKSYSEDDIHRSIKYSIWCSTEHGNMKLDNAFKDQMNIGPIYLFYSVNGSGHFCGIAQMVSPVDYNASSGVWAQGSKWKGQFKVKWIYVKDVPNSELRHIVLENNEFKPVTNSRDTQEVPPEKGRAVLEIIHAHQHKTSIFDDFFHYERKQYEELIASRQRMVESPPMSDRSSNASGRPSHHYQPTPPPQQQQQPYNKPRQNESYSRDTNSPADNLNNSNNSKTSLISSNYEPSSTGGTQIKKSWAEQCD